MPSTLPPFPSPGLDLSHLFLLQRCWEKPLHIQVSPPSLCPFQQLEEKGLMARRSPLSPLLLWLLLFQGEEEEKGTVVCVLRGLVQLPEAWCGANSMHDLDVVLQDTQRCW